MAFLSLGQSCRGEGKIRFWGNSFVAGPLGEIVAHAGAKREEIFIANCDLARSKRRAKLAVSARPAYRRLWRLAIACPRRKDLDRRKLLLLWFFHLQPRLKRSATLCRQSGRASRHLAFLAAQPRNLADLSGKSP